MFLQFGDGVEELGNEKKPERNRYISQAVTSATATFLLMPEIFLGGDGQSWIFLLGEAYGGSGGWRNTLIPSSFNVGIALTVTIMAGIALVATLVYSSRR